MMCSEAPSSLVPYLCSYRCSYIAQQQNRNALRSWFPATGSHDYGHMFTILSAKPFSTTWGVPASFVVAVLSCLRGIQLNVLPL
jgi:hypothetical protein